MKLKLFIAWMTVVCTCMQPVWSQDLQQDYTPEWNFSPADKDILELRRRFLSWVPKAGIADAEARRHFFQSTLAKSQLLHQLDSMNMLMATDTFTRLLNHLVQHIVSHNPSIDSNSFTLFTFRGEEANAYNLGEGIIFFNLAMLERLKTVDEVAFILAHEIGHDLERHVYNNSVAYSRGLYEDVFNTDSLKTKRKRAMRLSVIEPILDQFNAEQLGFRRDMELAADSIGFMLAVNAGFDRQRALEMIEASAMERDLMYTDSLPLASLFNFDDLPFQSHWLVPQDLQPPWDPDTTLYITPDSLLTHPVWDDRIKRLKQLPATDPANEIEFPLSAAFNRQLANAPFETLAALIQAGNYTSALHNALHIHQQYPENIFVNSIIAHSLLEIAKATKAGNFLSQVAIPGMQHPAATNYYLHFLHNLRSDEMMALYEAYAAKYLRGHQGHPYVAFIREIEKSLPTQQAATAYKAKFNVPFYVMLLEQRVQPETGKK